MPRKHYPVEELVDWGAVNAEPLLKVEQNFMENEPVGGIYAVTFWPGGRAGRILGNDWVVVVVLGAGFLRISRAAVRPPATTKTSTIRPTINNVFLLLGD